MARQAPPITPTPATPPSDADVAALLGEAQDAFRALVHRKDGAIAEWRRYSERSPWVLRVRLEERTLFYALPQAGAVRVTVLLGKRAVEAALAGQVSTRLHASIRKARAYAEGRPVVVLVRRAADLVKVDELVAVKLGASARTARPRPSK